jgi:hypothetical protein
LEDQLMLLAFRLLSLTVGVAAVIKTIELMHAATAVVANAGRLGPGVGQ